MIRSKSLNAVRNFRMISSRSYGLSSITRKRMVCLNYCIQFDPEGTSLPRRRAQSHTSSHKRDRFAHRCQPQSYSGILFNSMKLSKRGKETGLVLWRNTNPIVLNLDTTYPSSHLSTKFHSWLHSWRGEFTGIREKVGQSHLQQDRIRLYAWKLTGQHDMGALVAYLLL